ncbi:DUF424 family protein [Candidatus Micrarchaeota archaeon]|nr:DUF424 family protein [Candidatus Micrarchaeota archaeon]
MMAKVHERKDRHGNVWNVTAMCDHALLGKVLKEGEVTLDLKSYRNFYEGKKVSAAEAVQLLKDARNVNVVGPKSVACAKKAFPVDERQIKFIQGVPHIQVYYV